jgi:hypothetical protein
MEPTRGTTGRRTLVDVLREIDVAVDESREKAAEVRSYEAGGQQAQCGCDDCSTPTLQTSW